MTPPETDDDTPALAVRHLDAHRNVYRCSCQRAADPWWYVYRDAVLHLVMVHWLSQGDAEAAVTNAGSAHLRATQKAQKG